MLRTLQKRVSPLQHLGDEDMQSALLAVARDGPAADPAHLALLLRKSREDAVDSRLRALCHREAAELIRERAAHLGPTAAALRNTASLAGIDVPLSMLWFRTLPLVQLLLSWPHESPCCLVGLAGAPGAGKTTLCKILSSVAQQVTGQNVLTVSLDDFYLPPDVRQQRGHRWRAVPGTHDVDLLNRFVAEIKSSGGPISVPSYDSGAEVRRPPQVLPGPPRLCLFEGWFVGSALDDYDTLRRSLDTLIFLDIDLSDAREARLDREAKVRQLGAKRGMPQSAVERFWDEALLPGTSSWVLPLRNSADLVLELDREHRIQNIRIPNETTHLHGADPLVGM